MQERPCEVRRDRVLPAGSHIPTPSSMTTSNRIDHAIFLSAARPPSQGRHRLSPSPPKPPAYRPCELVRRQEHSNWIPVRPNITAVCMTVTSVQGTRAHRADQINVQVSRACRQVSVQSASLLSPRQPEPFLTCGLETAEPHIRSPLIPAGTKIPHTRGHRARKERNQSLSRHLISSMFSTFAGNVAFFRSSCAYSRQGRALRSLADRPCDRIRSPSTPASSPRPCQSRAGR